MFLNLKIPERFLDFLLIFLLGVVDLSIAGSFVSGLVMFSEGKTLLLAFLLFPICVPVFIPCVLATAKVVSDTITVDVMSELRLLLAFLFSVIGVSYLTFTFVLEE